jgi:adenylate cyclase, class 2
MLAALAGFSDVSFSMKTKMHQEIEAKYRVADLAGVAAAVLRAGGSFVRSAVQTDRYYDTADGSLLRGDCGLRLRQTRALGGRAKGKSPLPATLTYKGPRRRDCRAKSRPELETPVANSAAMDGVLRAVGLLPCLVIQKRRKTYRLGQCLVELDELPILGRFVEIEGPSVRAIESAARGLGLAGEPPLKASYAHLASEACQRLGRRRREITFARCK